MSDSFSMLELFQPLEADRVAEVILPSCRRDWGKVRNISTLEITRWPSREADWAEVPSQFLLSPPERSTRPRTVSQPGRVPSFKVISDSLIILSILEL